MNKLTYLALVGAVIAQPMPKQWHPHNECFDSIDNPHVDAETWTNMAKGHGKIAEINASFIDNKNYPFLDDPKHIYEKFAICYSIFYQKLVKEKPETKKLYEEWVKLQNQEIELREKYDDQILNADNVKAELYERIRKDIHKERKFEEQYLHHHQLADMDQLHGEQMGAVLREYKNQKEYIIQIIKAMATLNQRMIDIGMRYYFQNSKHDPKLKKAAEKYWKYNKTHCVPLQKRLAQGYSTTLWHDHEYHAYAAVQKQAEECQKYMFTFYWAVAATVKDPAFDKAIRTDELENKVIFEYTKQKIAHFEKDGPHWQKHDEDIEKRDFIQAKTQYQIAKQDWAAKTKMQAQVEQMDSRLKESINLYHTTMAQIQVTIDDSDAVQAKLNAYVSHKDFQQPDGGFNLMEQESRNDESYASWGSVALMSGGAIGAGVYFLSKKQQFNQEKDIEASLI